MCVCVRVGAYVWVWGGERLGSSNLLSTNLDTLHCSGDNQDTQIAFSADLLDPYNLYTVDKNSVQHRARGDRSCFECRRPLKFNF